MKVYMVLYLNIGIIMSQNLFFSEYAEGSSNNKYLEIYNGGSETINLNIYQLVNCRNGCDSWEHSHLFNEDTALNTADVWVFCAVDANDVIKAECNQTIANNSIFNGNDVWAIQEINTSTILDIIGEIGDDPGAGWDVAGESNATKNHTLVRSSSITSGNGGDWTSSAGTDSDNSEWIVLSEDDFTNLGSHTCSACGESTICNDSSACNFGNEGECTYPEENYDCDGECGGSAELDDCGICEGGNADDLGCGCFEPGPSGCDNECGSTLENDACGVCGGDGSDDLGCGCFESGPSGCDNACDSILEIDGCGVCNGLGAVYDCGCEGLTDGTCDCDGNILDCDDVCGGSAVIDECGVCNGLGAIYECGCNELIEGTCDCNGNELDVCGDCGGGIIDSVNCNLELKTVRPQNYKMINAYPNPFNSNTTITLHNMGNTFVKLDIIDLNGHIVDSIYSGYIYEKSTLTFLWDASENNSGIYIARISQNKKIITHKIILLK